MMKRVQIHDLLQATKPPLEIIDHLGRYQNTRQLPAPAVLWLERWKRIYAGEPDPLLDELTTSTQKSEG